MTRIHCNLCKGDKLNFVFSEENRGVTFKSYHCPSCDLYQTLGDEVVEVSPDYVNLGSDDLDEAHVYLQRAHKQPAFDEWLATIEKLMGPTAAARRLKFLDIGCGVGGFLDYASAQGFETYGFDASQAQIEVARQNHPHVRRATSLDEYLAALGNDVRFDLVTMWDVLEHIREPQSLLGGIALRLHADSIFFASIPSGSPTRLKVALARLRGRPLGLIPWEHVFYYTPRSLRMLMEKVGFYVLELNGVSPYVRSPSLFEITRRAVHRILRQSPYALQISVFAGPANPSRYPGSGRASRR